MAWTAADIGEQHGKTIVITGANTGIGFATARLLAYHGATVVLACRDLGKGRAAAARLGPAERVRPVRLDLASLDSIRSAADELSTTCDRIDVLINNAGLLMPPRTLTADGFELHLGVNHLGHYALTGLLLPRLLATPASRIVTVSSIGHRRGEIDFGDLQLERDYRPNTAYFQSKLANLLFTYELARRLAAAGSATIAVAAHPGNARTEFGRNMNVVVRAAMKPLARPLTWWLIQSPEMGALASIRAAVDPGAHGGDYFGPPGRAQFTGYPERVTSSARSYDIHAQARLWAESERLTGVTYPLGSHVS